jgi:SNF2 family DNA or RNA helicase
VALTGTPIQNNTSELWCLLSFLYQDYIVENEDASVESLAKLVHHVMLRRTKVDVASDLPKKKLETVFLEPTPEQQALSQQVCTEGLTKNSLSSTCIHLRKIACHPMLIDLLDGEEDAEDKPTTNPDDDLTARGRFIARNMPIDDDNVIGASAKLVRLDMMLPKLREEGHRVVIFSTFRAMLDVVEVFCEMRKYPFVRLDGMTPTAQREIDMHRFNAPTSNLFIYLVTTTAGGVGITLVGADTLILLDPHWNPSVDAQAIDRVHRLGQTRPVMVYRFVQQQSVEMKILETAEKKTELGYAVMKVSTRVESSTRMITRNDLEAWASTKGRVSLPVQVSKRVDAWSEKLLNRTSLRDREIYQGKDDDEGEKNKVRVLA